jgi:hypothetical protein
MQRAHHRPRAHAPAHHTLVPWAPGRRGGEPKRRACSLLAADGLQGELLAVAQSLASCVASHVVCTHAAAQTSLVSRMPDQHPGESSSEAGSERARPHAKGLAPTLVRCVSRSPCVEHQDPFVLLGRAGEVYRCTYEHRGRSDGESATLRLLFYPQPSALCLGGSRLDSHTGSGECSGAQRGTDTRTWRHYAT